jgi:hypothetical protein
MKISQRRKVGRVERLQVSLPQFGCSLSSMGFMTFSGCLVIFFLASWFCKNIIMVGWILLCYSNMYYWLHWMAMIFLIPYLATCAGFWHCYIYPLGYVMISTTSVEMICWAYWSWMVLVYDSLGSHGLGPFLFGLFMNLIAHHIDLGLMLQSFARITTFLLARGCLCILKQL